MAEPLILQVSDFVALCNQTMEYAYPSVIIEGELSDFRISRGKWVYFDIKDEFSSLRCFGTVYMLPGPLEDGMKVRIYGAPRLHPKYNFSINLMKIEPAGEGSLKRAFELLKAKLSAEGLFDEDRKRRIPAFPETIGIVASVESAAYGDFMKILKARWPQVEVYVCNVQVQGDAAAVSLVEGIQQINGAAPHCDAIVITRGGGSADDLAVFNDERVVRAIASSRIPTVVAVGHERDVSLAELVADLRASTPSNAAELLLPDSTEQRAWLLRVSQLLQSSVLHVAQQEHVRLDAMRSALQKNAELLFASNRQQLAAFKQLLVAYNPEAALARGYALVRSAQGEILVSISNVRVGDKIVTQLSDGELISKVLEVQG